MRLLFKFDTSTACLLLTLAMMATSMQAKGLDALSEANPEEKQDKPEDGDQTKGADGQDKGDGEKNEAVAPSAISKSLSQKLFMSTSFGWVKASRSPGTWTGSGMSDLTIGYKIFSVANNMDMATTYRYAPTAVSGTTDSHYYRSVWEAHYFGGRVSYKIAPNITGFGAGELGLVQIHATPSDTVPDTTNGQSSGAAVCVGGGADLHFTSMPTFAAGPRLHLAVGSITTVQVAAGADFTF